MIVNGSELNPAHWDRNARLSGKLSLDHFPTKDFISKSFIFNILYFCGGQMTLTLSNDNRVETFYKFSIASVPFC